MQVESEKLKRKGEKLEYYKELKPPGEFKFPFKPYEIQERFMRGLFECLEGQKWGIFESPTGTGKSLSMVCGSLTWLLAHKEEKMRALKEGVEREGQIVIKEEESAKKDNNWILAHHKLKQRKEHLDKMIREMKFIESYESKLRKIRLSRRNDAGRNGYFRSQKLTEMAWGSAQKNDNEHKENESIVDKEVDEFAPDVDSDSDLSEDGDDEPEFFAPKVIFASRTHSQLSQFSKEFKRTDFSNNVAMCSVGSRKNLCINPIVSRLGNLSMINERCLELQKETKAVKKSETKKLKRCGGCPYFEHSRVEELKNKILATPMDIEDLIKTGKSSKACPYYASRKAANEAELVLLPYNTILHSCTREAIKLRLENSVIILDEAHNILESLSNMHTSMISRQQLMWCHDGLKNYIKRYLKFFKAKKLLLLKQIGFIMKGLLRLIDEETDDAVFSMHEFRSKCDIDNLNLHEISRFMKQTKLILKLKGYVTKVEFDKKSEGDREGEADIENSLSKESLQAGNSVLAFSEFFSSLLMCTSEGKIILSGKTLKFLLLNPTRIFFPVLEKCRSLVLAGGTMKPYEDIVDQLFLNHESLLYYFSCDHVIPEENLVCLAVSNGPGSTVFDFTYNNRNSPKLMKELASALLNFSRIVPDGIVVFLPSYEYESLFYNYLESTEFLEKIENKKKVYREPKSLNCEKILFEYSRGIEEKKNGGILFAVVGGKLSEGINFSDGLGRCIIIVGLPYPNMKSIEMKEKVDYITSNFGKEKGGCYVSNLCSKAVNQSIGRAIRHANDYASIVLLDARYSRPTQISLLPNWIKKSYKSCCNFGEAVSKISLFFNKK